MAAVIGAARRGRGGRRRDRRLRRAGQRQLDAPGRARRRDGGRRRAVAALAASAATRRSLLPVSHAFHTEIVAPASEPLRATLQRLGLRAAAAADRGQRRRRVLPVGRRRAGADARPARAPGRLAGAVRQGPAHAATTRARGSSSRSAPSGRCRASPPTCSATTGSCSLSTNHPKVGDVASFNNALCGLWAAGLRARHRAGRRVAARSRRRSPPRVRRPPPSASRPARRRAGTPPAADTLRAQRLFAEFLERGRELLGDRPRPDGPSTEPVVITGAALGTARRRAALRRRQRRPPAGRRRRASTSSPAGCAARCSTSTSRGWSRATTAARRFETIDRLDDVIKLAARAGAFDLGEEFGVDADRARRARARHAAGDRRRHRRAARRRHPARPALQDDDARAPSCPTAGRCPTSCATTPA